MTEAVGDVNCGVLPLKMMIYLGYRGCPIPAMLEISIPAEHRYHQ